MGHSNSRMRKYASFFEWSDKPTKEIGVVEELLISLNKELGLGLHSLQSFNPDPPDCICLNTYDQLVAIEVVEVVCQEAVRLNAKGNDVYRLWGRGELAPHIEQLLKRKDKKTYHGGPYGEVIVCLFTDELTLSPDFVSDELRSVFWGPYKQISSAFLLLSYNPESRVYPVFQIKLGNQ